MKARITAHPAEKQREGELITVGWREWIGFPDWDIRYIKAKVDTGARTSSLHADTIELFQSGEEMMVRFVVHPWQSSSEDLVAVELPVFSMREVRSSTGVAEQRPVIRTAISVSGITLLAEITLTNRDQMGFRMLLGREVLRGRFLINPGISYLGGRPPKDIRRKNRGRTT